VHFPQRIYAATSGSFTRFSTLSMAESRCNLVHANRRSIMIDLP
jgi:hypothetical protein